MNTIKDTFPKIIIHVESGLTYFLNVCAVLSFKSYSTYRKNL